VPDSLGKSGRDRPRNSGIQFRASKPVRRLSDDPVQNLKRRLRPFWLHLKLFELFGSSKPKRLSANKQDFLIKQIHSKHPEIVREILEAERDWSNCRNSRKRHDRIFGARTSFDRACGRLGFSPSRFDLSPVFAQLIRSVQDQLQSTGAPVFGRIDKELFERTVAAIERDPEVVRLWLETINSPEGVDPDGGFHPVLIRAHHRSDEIAKEYIPSGTTRLWTDVWFEARNRLTARYGSPDKSSRLRKK
jgi:hypothetical protein